MISFSAKKEEASIVRAFVGHSSHESQTVVEHLIDKDRSLSLLLAGI